MPRVGIIGGSGLYNMKGLEVLSKVHIETPFGSPSGAVVLGRLDGVEVSAARRSADVDTGREERREGGWGRESKKERRRKREKRKATAKSVLHVIATGYRDNLKEPECRTSTKRWCRWIALSLEPSMLDAKSIVASNTEKRGKRARRKEDRRANRKKEGKRVRQRDLEGNQT